jgi:hypothetical protein
VATYAQIQNECKREFGFVPKTCWIADLKAEHGLTRGAAPNRAGAVRMNPCPGSKRSRLFAVMKRLYAL